LGGVNTIIIISLFTAFAYFAAAAFGLPMHLLFSALGWESAGVYLAGGGIIWVIMLELVGFLVSWQWVTAPSQLALYGGAGAISSLVFWAIEVKWSRRLP
jgi:hypothetical protein